MKYNTHNDYLESFSEYLTLKGKSKKTCISLVNMCSYYLHWCEETSTDELTASYNDVVAYMNYCKNKGNVQRTIQLNVNAIKHFYNQLLELDMVSKNPALTVSVQGIKRKKLVYTFTPLELENIYKSYETEREYKSKVPPQHKNLLARKRNKVILSLLIYQGLRSEELQRLTLSDLKLREGKIFITGSRRTGERTLKLETFQVFDLMDYANETRKALLELTKQNTTQLFVNVNAGVHFNNIMQKLINPLKPIETRLTDAKQIRTSVITNWLKVHNLRKVQYMAGHKYISSTEAYQVNNIEDLVNDIDQYHPV